MLQKLKAIDALTEGFGVLQSLAPTSRASALHPVHPVTPSARGQVRQLCDRTEVVLAPRGALEASSCR